MGSFPTKSRKSPQTDRRAKACNEEAGTSIEDENVNKLVEKVSPQLEEAVAVSANEHRSKIQEQLAVPKARQSFSWLVSKKEKQKEKERKPKKAKSKNVMKYRNQKYVLAWQNSTESPKGKDDGGSHSSSKAKKQGKCKKKTEGDKFKPGTSSSKK